MENRGHREGVMSVEGLLSCQISSWYPQFQQICFPTKLIPLPREFVNYLIADGVYVAENSRMFGAEEGSVYSTEESETESLDESDEDGSEGEDASTSRQAGFQEFPELMAEIDAAIQHLDGKVVPKLNWSTPTDTVWMLPNNRLQCVNSEEVVLVLKSSDRIAHDICNAFDHCPDPPAPPVQYVCALRKWYNLRPESEFRGFVRDNELVAVCQRDVSHSFAQLEGEEARVRQRMEDFFERRIRGRFPLENYTFDVYINSRGRVRLLDFNAIGGATSPLLFSWDELGYDMTAELVVQSNEHSESQEEDGDQRNNRVAPHSIQSSERSEREVMVRFVEKGPGFMLGQRMAVAVPYDMIGSSVSDVVEAMRNCQRPDD